MKSVVIHTEGQVCVEERPAPSLQAADEVLVRVAYSGLCGSDIPRIFAQGAHFYPITLGHEFSGHVVAYGESVNDLQENDAVACVPLLPCFNCPECQRHYYSLCKNYQFIGSRSHGGNAELVVVKRANLVKLPVDVSLLQGAFIEPITVGLHAILLAGGCEGKEVIVIGAGTIGQLAIQCAKAMGANSVTAIDINNERLQLASKLGAGEALNSEELSPSQIGEHLQERRFDQLILETAGTPETVSLALNIAGPRAQVALIGTLHRDLHLSHHTFSQILRKELTLLGSWMNYSAPWPGEEWRQAMKLFQSAKLAIEPLIASVDRPQQYAASVSALAGGPMQGKIMLKLTED
ncbi:galactitol-1-phosphate 5-dehydrogenase [Serratia aquatilis]|uniref:Galactitol-1-phosphate 5-dehydrogenase n=1 Tax=Serratia aquatilis TaxID=1737515 RepID=A0ABV6EI84_9GAMM